MRSNLSITQGSETWLEWRKKGIGSSEAAAIMGASPWATPLKVWEIKTGRRGEDPTNFAMQRGLDLEPQARAIYELQCDLDMPPALVVHPYHDFIRASLDGFNPGIRKILEIKCPGKEAHEMAVAGKIPEKYIWQCVHQLMAADGDHVDYFSFRNGAGAVVRFERDLEREKQLIEAEHRFWGCVLADIPPGGLSEGIQ